jgi:hypothetical protein
MDLCAAKLNQLDPDGPLRFQPEKEDEEQFIQKLAYDLPAEEAAYKKRQEEEAKYVSRVPYRGRVPTPPPFSLKKLEETILSPEIRLQEETRITEYNIGCLRHVGMKLDVDNPVLPYSVHDAVQTHVYLQGCLSDWWDPRWSVFLNRYGFILQQGRCSLFGHETNSFREEAIQEAPPHAWVNPDGCIITLSIRGDSILRWDCMSHLEFYLEYPCGFHVYQRYRMLNPKQKRARRARKGKESVKAASIHSMQLRSSRRRACKRVQ